MKPLLQVLNGQALEPPPIWLMRQAGRYLPEYRALRAKAKGFVDMALNPEMAAEITLQPVRRFGMDGAILFADILLIPHALGQSLTFVEGEGPRLEPMRNAAGLARLSYKADILSPVMETVKRVRAALPAHTTLIGFAGAPWTVATYMIEGRGKNEYENCRRMMWSEPKLFMALMDVLVDATIAYLNAQADAGAEALKIFDSWAGAVPASLFDMAVIGPTARIVKGVRAKHPNIRIIGLPRGAGSHLARYVAETSVDAVGVDHMTDIAAAAASLPAGVAVQGNLDPMLLMTGGAAMEAEARRIVEAMRGRRFIFNLGHGVLQHTPPEHVARLVDVVKGR
ncbi:MAG: uroporphyrinogen decarboxylase [Alphaproteobacteria bacterium]|nr:uroporphyrinogen decarboxylase [Alphaproteobacteria bacterium]